MALKKYTRLEYNGASGDYWRITRIMVETTSDKPMGYIEMSLYGSRTAYLDNYAPIHSKRIELSGQNLTDMLTIKGLAYAKVKALDADLATATDVLE